MVVLVAVKAVNEPKKILWLSQQRELLFVWLLSDISRMGRNTQGVKLIRFMGR